MLVAGCAAPPVKQQHSQEAARPLSEVETADVKKIPRSAQKYRGVTMLQTKEVGFDSELSEQSFRELAKTGANAVALIPFLHQQNCQDDYCELSDSVTDAQLVWAIRRAHAQHLKVIVKPQILVEGAWAGLIEPQTDKGWQDWFASYTQALMHYAKIAQAEGAEGFVIGTELKRADGQPHWAALIKSVRGAYGGMLTYAAHNHDSISAFEHWDMLDEIGVTLYPPLGPVPSRDMMQKKVEAVVATLEDLSRQYNKKIFVLEVGSPSVVNIQATPWDRPKGCEVQPDANLQATIVDIWLNALRKPWVSGVLVWDWHSDPYAGGRFDTDFTIQNKPAQDVVSCHWAGKCVLP
jgi:hypothetical protein